MGSITATLDYPTLVSRVEPKIIRDEKLNEKFVALLEGLDARWDELSAAERALHGLLVLLIEDFASRV